MHILRQIFHYDGTQECRLYCTVGFGMFVELIAVIDTDGEITVCGKSMEGARGMVRFNKNYFWIDKFQKIEIFYKVNPWDTSFWNFPFPK